MARTRVQQSTDQRTGREDHADGRPEDQRRDEVIGRSSWYERVWEQLPLTSNILPAAPLQGARGLCCWEAGVSPGTRHTSPVPPPEPMPIPEPDEGPRPITLTSRVYLEAAGDVYLRDCRRRVWSAEQSQDKTSHDLVFHDMK